MKDTKQTVKKVLPVAAGILGAAATLAAAALTKKSNRQKMEKLVKGLQKQSEVLKDKGMDVLDEVVEKADVLRQEMEAATKKIKSEDEKPVKQKKSVKKSVK